MSRSRWREFPAIHRHINNIVCGEPVDGASKRLHMCRDKMNQFKPGGKTIVFVSHALNAVKELCQRSVLLNEGRIVTMGDTEKVINTYLALLQAGNT